MNHYIKNGFNEFIIAAGYKNNIIKQYFKNYKNSEKKFKAIINKKKCTITIVDTGIKTMTGGRLKRIKNFLEDNTSFMFTYGDGISNVNLKKLLIFHYKHKKLITVTAVRPPARFGK